MGAWGTGPFDSDATLDWFGDLAERHARRDADTDEIIAASVDRDGVRDAMRAKLRGDSGFDATLAYAAAGLVARTRAGATASMGGTRLLSMIAGDDDPIDPLGLGSDCGYGVLVDPEMATELLDDAVAAVELVRNDTEWVDGWYDDEIITQLDRLAATLR